MTLELMLKLTFAVDVFSCLFLFQFHFLHVLHVCRVQLSLIDHFEVELYLCSTNHCWLISGFLSSFICIFSSSKDRTSFIPTSLPHVFLSSQLGFFPLQRLESVDFKHRQDARLGPLCFQVRSHLRLWEGEKTVCPPPTTSSPPQFICSGLNKQRLVSKHNMTQHFKQTSLHVDFAFLHHTSASVLLFLLCHF